MSPTKKDPQLSEISKKVDPLNAPVIIVAVSENSNQSLGSNPEKINNLVSSIELNEASSGANPLIGCKVEQIAPSKDENEESSNEPEKPDEISSEAKLFPELNIEEIPFSEIENDESLYSKLKNGCSKLKDRLIETVKKVINVLEGLGFPGAASLFVGGSLCFWFVLDLPVLPAVGLAIVGAGLFVASGFCYGTAMKMRKEEEEALKKKTVVQNLKSQNAKNVIDNFNAVEHFGKPNLG